MIKTLILPLAAAALVGLTGCAGTSDRTAGRVMDDKAVNARVKDALDDATVYKFDSVDVSTHNGVVQLSGWATTDEQKTKAAQIARGVEGVHEVINNISIKVTPTGRDSGYPNRTNGTPPKADAPLKQSDEIK